MRTKSLLSMSLFCLAFSSLFSINSQAHPNHMSFENVQHEVQNRPDTTFNNTDKLLHDTQQQQHKHGDAVPCKDQQHKAGPCKRK